MFNFTTATMTYIPDARYFHEFIYLKFNTEKCMLSILDSREKRMINKIMKSLALTGYMSICRYNNSGI